MTEVERQDVIIAPGVAESIVALAVAQVDGVAQIGSKAPNPGGLLSVLTKKPSSQGVVLFDGEQGLTVDIHLKLFYGYRLHEVAEQVRLQVVDALLTQACIAVDRVDLTIDGIIFRP